MNAEQRLLLSTHADLTLDQLQIGSHLINYAVGGRGDPLILLHGANIGWGQWYPNIAQLSQNFRVYALDLPGAGHSNKINFRTLNLERDFVDTVEGFIKIKNLKNASLIGHSLGGWIAMKLALRNLPSLDKIVLVSPIGFSGFVPFKHRLLAFYPLAKLLSMTAMKPTAKNMKNFSLDVMYDKSKEPSPEFVDYLCEAIAEKPNNHPLMLIHRLTGLRRMKKELILTSVLPQIHNQTLVIMGAEDPQIPIDQVRSAVPRLPNAQLKLLAKIGHLPPLEATKQFNEIVLAFLTRGTGFEPPPNN